MKNENRKLKQAGRIACNARCIVDYSKPKPTVKFSYPSKNELGQNRGNIISSLLSMGVIILLIILIQHVYFVPIQIIDPPHNCTFNPILNFSLPIEAQRIYSVDIFCDTYNASLYWRDQINKTTLINFLSIGRNYNYFFATYSLKSKNLESYNSLYQVLRTLSVMAIFIIVMIILLKFCSKIFTKILLKFKWFKDAVPYINKGFLPSGYYIKFTKVPEQKYLEIPLFKNVKLEYRAKGSFSDNLIRVEVKEHPFSEVAHSVGTLRRLKKLDKLNIKKKKAARAKLKLKKNIWLWYARFYFKEIPTSGCLEVSFE